MAAPGFMVSRAPARPITERARALLRVLEDGPIEVDVSRPDPGNVSIAVRDHGIGIPVEHRQRLFDRAYRVRPGDNVAGMGLGLFIARQIVESHGGSIAVEAPPDGGSRFIVTLPVGDDRSDETRPT